MNYALEILNRELIYETQCRADALNHFNGGNVSPKSGSEESTWIAFQESLRLAEERIPQLVDALRRINASDHP